MKCSVCKTCSPHLTKVEKKLFCDQCKPNLMQVKIEATPIKLEIDPDSNDSSDSSSNRVSLQKQLKREITLQQDDETVDSEDHSLEMHMSYSSTGIDDNAGESNTSGSFSIASVGKLEKKCYIATKRDQKMKCHLCDYRCNSLTSIRNHRKKNHPEIGNFRCKICYRSFNGLLNLDKHIDEEHDGFGAKCKICLQKFKRGQRLAHQRECEGQHLFSCGTCGKQYVKLESLRKHLDEHGVAEAMKDRSIIKRRTKEHLFICVICEEGLVYDKEPYWKHVKEQHDGHYLRCDDCGKTFKNSHSWFNHKISYCKVGQARERFIPEEMLCPHCSKSCKNKAYLDSHMYNYHSKSEFNCDECGMTFPSAKSCRYHKDKVHSEPKFECPQCSKKFHFVTKLKQHLLTHEGGPIECKICGITFKYRNVLSRHNYMKHRPRETIECKQCSKRFNMRSHYTVHMRKKHGHDGTKTSPNATPTAASESATENKFIVSVKQ